MIYEQLRWSGRWSTTGGSRLDDASLVLYFGGNNTINSGERYCELRDRFSDAIIVGCSSGGEIINDQSLEGSVVAFAIKFRTTRVRAHAIQVSEIDQLEKSAESLASELNDDALVGAIVFGDGVHLNGSALVRGLNRGFKKQVPLVGGLAVDNKDMSTSFVGVDGTPTEKTVVAVGLYGSDIKLRYSTFHGCRPLSPISFVSRAKHQVIYEINDEPALDFFQRYLGAGLTSLQDKLFLYPLKILPYADTDYSFLRTVVEVQTDTRALVCATDVPANSRVQVMRGELEDLVSAVEIAAEEALGQVNSLDEYLGILVSCIGRKIAHGPALQSEIDAVSQALGEQVKTIGFYSHGEICPHSKTGINELHNHTMTMFFISEETKKN